MTDESLRAILGRLSNDLLDAYHAIDGEVLDGRRKRRVLALTNILAEEFAELAGDIQRGQAVRLEHERSEA